MQRTNFVLDLTTKMSDDVEDDLADLQTAIDAQCNDAEEKMLQDISGQGCTAPG